MDAVTVPDGAVRMLSEQGWCRVPNVLDAAQCAHALERLHAAAAESEARGVSTFMPVLDPNAANVRVFYRLELDALFREMIRHPTALALVRSLLGPHAMISNFTANIAKPGARSMALHSDQSLVVPEPWVQPWAINIIWCLTDVTFENGGTLHIPGSHLWQQRSDVPPDALEQLRPFEAKAGSIVAMDGRLWHTSGANITADQERALLFGYYTKPFLRPQVNWNAALSPELQAGLDAEMREWLGLDREANTGEAADVRPGGTGIAREGIGA
jgi:ectoine hydroxylase-related dioxygenase (phytanoyl-CoA dioxygenase family)